MYRQCLFTRMLQTMCLCLIETMCLCLIDTGTWFEASEYNCITRVCKCCGIPCIDSVYLLGCFKPCACV
ncbi:hypothetical protein PR003_g18721 [Phytophthora rubi]|uniref:Secreted protein n=1 Tax=Phytophthora rubi TaxID=129364 RepID=A0A6A4E518_9STRA|nr:hypothetical protein PR002_g20239 [Phytophthora rubi]KAE8997974.1 hypothetical protein PR001_g19445 [Phytophthora rubi]KAE9316429.1 hypothetical protein PR003_g18721 [Phytophthora rubi]